MWLIRHARIKYHSSYVKGTQFTSFSSAALEEIQWPNLVTVMLIDARAPHSAKPSASIVLCWTWLLESYFFYWSFQIRVIRWRKVVEDVSIHISALHMMWKLFPDYWSLVKGIHSWLVDFLHRVPSIRSFDVFFAVSLSKLLSRHSRCRWFETSWRWCDVTVMES